MRGKGKAKMDSRYSVEASLEFKVEVEGSLRVSLWVFFSILLVSCFMWGTVLDLQL